ncbi:uncharacterized protein N7482_002633 [Penicillium canariense]|uniref:Uncharacterized protein n=1 Tax=Penicillium canariense TaxID=189055 RepID=A0A9W9IM44_9EURO|nr:uncharacterized protein N7482_002633 [Penicillium canariense]KAJ5176756.1 hypothetical protein N7482_002633 [Penicillium canariense]
MLPPSPLGTIARCAGIAGAGRRGRRRREATAPALGDAEKRVGVALRAQGEALVGSVGGRNGDGGDARDVIDRVGEADGRRAENGRERRRAREGDALSSRCAE